MADEILVFVLPDVGEGLTEGEILAWHVQPGDVVTINQTIVEIETAKAAVELPCPYAGTVVDVHVEPGEVVPVGSPLISIRVTQSASQREAVLVGYGVREDVGVRRRPRKSVRLDDHGRPTASRAKPLVRKLAKDLGLDITTVEGTGVNGDVTREDVLRAVNEGASAPSTPATAVIRGDERMPVRGVHRAMADAMVLSAFTAPHVSVILEVDMKRTLELVTRLRTHPKYADVRINPFTIVSLALIRAAKKHPLINATWVEGGDSSDIIIHREVHLGMAADTPRGLLVPVVHGADSMSIHGLAHQQGELIERARAGRSTPAELTGSTVTVTNVGVFGVDAGTPIINPGESAILAMGRIIDKPWVVDGNIVIRPVMQLSLSFDHRVCDGKQGSQAIVTIGDFLSDPAVDLLLDP